MATAAALIVTTRNIVLAKSTGGEVEAFDTLLMRFCELLRRAPNKDAMNTTKANPQARDLTTRYTFATSTDGGNLWSSSELT